MSSYAQWLTNNTVPKLFVNGEPGGLLIGAQREFCRSWPKQTEVTVRGIHFLQEDSPDEIGQAIADWKGTREHCQDRPTPQMLSLRIISWGHLLARVFRQKALFSKSPRPGLMGLFVKKRDVRVGQGS